MNNQKFDYFIGNRFLDEANTYLDSRPNFNGIELTKSPIQLRKIGFGFYFPFKNKGERFNDIINHKTLSPQLIAGPKYLELINLFQNIE